MSIQAVRDLLSKPQVHPVKAILGRMCAMEGCREPQFEAFPTCEVHSWEIWAKLNGRTDSPQEQAAAEDAERGRHRKFAEENALIVTMAGQRMSEFQAAQRTAPGTIYYLQVEDKVKIGFTRDLHLRLQAYPPMSRLLATHPGTFQTEAEVHRKFAKHLAGRKEWFTANEELDMHIQSVRRDFKQDRRVIA